MHFSATIVTQSFNGRYDRDLDYQADPVPPLSADDAEWAITLLKEKQRRP